MTSRVANRPVAGAATSNVAPPALTSTIRSPSYTRSPGSANQMLSRTGAVPSFGKMMGTSGLLGSELMANDRLRQRRMRMEQQNPFESEARRKGIDDPLPHRADAHVPPPFALQRSHGRLMRPRGEHPAE